MARQKNNVDPIVEGLNRAAKVREAQRDLSNDSHKRNGDVIAALFDGIPQSYDINDLNRFNLLNKIVDNLLCYCENFHSGGSDESLDEISIYAQMLIQANKEIGE